MSKRGVHYTFHVLLRLAPEADAWWGESPYLFGSDGLLAGLLQLDDGFLIVAEIFLAADEDNGETAAKVHDFGDPLMSTC